MPLNKIFKSFHEIINPGTIVITTNYFVPFDFVPFETDNKFRTLDIQVYTKFYF